MLHNNRSWQKYILLSFTGALIIGITLYWFYSTNKAKIAEIKYYGQPGIATIYKKELLELGDDLRRWSSSKNQFHIGFLAQIPAAIDSFHQSQFGDKTNLYELNKQVDTINTIVEVSKAIWKLYQEGDTVKIKYLPKDPINYVIVLN